MPVNEEEMFVVFGDFDVDAHREEAEARWPGELVEESQRRTATYNKAQWRAALAEGSALAEEFGSLAASGVDPSSRQAAEVVERHRLHIDRWYYPCSREMHSNLATLYVEDERFAAYWNRIQPGLASYVAAAITSPATGSAAGHSG